LTWVLMSPWFGQGLMAQGLEAHYLDPSLCLDGEPDEVGEAAVGAENETQKRRTGCPLDRKSTRTEGHRAASPVVNRREEVLAPSVA